MNARATDGTCYLRHDVAIDYEMAHANTPDSFNVINERCQHVIHCE